MVNVRFQQIRKLNMNREELAANIGKINEPLISEIGEDNLKRYILEKISDLSLNDIENFKLKLLNFEGIETPKSLKIVQIFYTLLTKKILLPNNIDRNDYGKIKETLDGIVDKYNKKLNDRIMKIDDRFFNISLGDEISLDHELEDDYEVMPRSFTLGGIFGQVSMEVNDKEKRFMIEIPVRLNMKKGSTEQKYVDVEKLKDVLNRYFPRKPKSGDRFADFRVKTSTKVDKDVNYGPDPDATYFVISVYHSKNKSLSIDYIQQEEIIKTVKGFIGLTNCLVNDIAGLSSIDHGKKHYSFFSSHPYLFMEGHTGLKEEVDEKFSKLLVKMKKPIYMSDIGGQEKAKKELTKIILGIKNQEIMSQWGGKSTPGVLLYGPPGTGKTLLAMVLATEVDADVYNIKMTDIADSAYINDGPKNVKNMFEFIRHKARQNPGKKILIILDEMDALLKKRTGDKQSDEDKKIVNTFLAEMNGFDTINNVIFVGTTNNYHSLDGAVRRSGRFSTKIKVELPDEMGRLQIFNIHMKKAKKEAKRPEIFLQNIPFDRLSIKSEGMSGADIEEIIRMTVEAKAIEEINKLGTGEKTELICEQDILDSIAQLKNSNGKANEMIKNFGIDTLLAKLDGKNTDYFKDALHRIITDKMIAELQSALDSGKINSAQLMEVYEMCGKTGKVGF